MADAGGVEKILYAVANTDELMVSSGLIHLDLKEIAGHALMDSSGFGVTFFKLVGCVAATYLLVLDRTNWKTKITTSLLVPYIFFTLPNFIFFWFRGEFWKWIAFVGVVLRLFFSKKYREWLEMPGAMVVVVMLIAPEIVVQQVKDGDMSDFICLCIACYLLHEHVQASNSLRNAFRGAPNGISNSIGIVSLFLYPVWRAVLRFVAGIGS